MLGFIKNVATLIVDLTTGDKCFSCPHDCDHAIPTIPDNREAIVSWDEYPLVTIRKEKNKRPKDRPVLTREIARQRLFGLGMTYAEEKRLRRAAAVEFWNSLGF